MARFLGRVQGSRGEVTRLGSHIRAEANGWRSGVAVMGGEDAMRQDFDAFRIVLTGGSDGGRSEDIELGVLRETSEGRIFEFTDAAIRIMRNDGRLS